MHILTKFFIVVASLLSILLAGLSVAYSGNAQELKSRMLAAQAEGKAFSTQLEAQYSQTSLERDRLESENITLGQQLVTAQNEIASQRLTIGSLRDEISGLKSANLDTASKLTGIQGELGVNSTILESVLNELREVRAENLAYANRERELEDANNQLQSTLQVAQATNRTLQVQLQELRDEMDRVLANGGAASNGTSSARLSAPTNFRSSIAAVRTTDAGELLVSIPHGSNDQLRERMELSIFRGNKFVAKMILERVDLNEAVGVVTLSAGSLSPAKGDEVLPAGTTF